MGGAVKRAGVPEAGGWGRWREHSSHVQTGLCPVAFPRASYSTEARRCAQPSGLPCQQLEDQKKSCRCQGSGMQEEEQGSSKTAALSTWEAMLATGVAPSCPAPPRQALYLGPGGKGAHCCSQRCKRQDVPPSAPSVLFLSHSD